MQLTMSKMQAARETAGSSARGVKRHLAQDFQWQVVSAPDEQPIMLRNITPQGSSWRAGINGSPANLDQKAVQQVRQEMDAFKATLAIERRSGVQMAVASKSLREGDVVCCPGGLLFDKVEALAAFVNLSLIHI